MNALTGEWVSCKSQKDAEQACLCQSRTQQAPISLPQMQQFPHCCLHVYVTSW